MLKYVHARIVGMDWESVSLGRCEAMESHGNQVTKGSLGLSKELILTMEVVY